MEEAADDSRLDPRASSVVGRFDLVLGFPTHATKMIGIPRYVLSNSTRTVHTLVTICSQPN
jgi:hypothetical protein